MQPILFHVSTAHDERYSVAGSPSNLESYSVFMYEINKQFEDHMDLWLEL